MLLEKHVIYIGLMEFQINKYCTGQFDNKNNTHVFLLIKFNVLEFILRK